MRSVGVTLWVCAALTSAVFVGVRSGRADEIELPKLPTDRLPAKLDLDAIPLGLDSKRLIPADNPLTPERVRLGRKLFFDPILSVDGTASCASCHDPARGFAGPHQRAIGVKGAKGLRNSPSVINRAYGRAFFWDGRAASLEEQALLPIENKLELGSDIKQVVERLQADSKYRASFQAAYKGGVTAENLARALAGFQRVLLSGDSPVDRFHAGEFSALTYSQRQGMWIFESRGRCWRCHAGANFSDEQFHNTGVSWGKEPLDLGRQRVTKKESDSGRFKTPSLRDIARSAPYMHDGSLATLTQVVEFYNRGGGKNPHLDPIMAPLELSKQDVGHLVAYLKALTGSTNWIPVESKPPKTQ